MRTTHYRERVLDLVRAERDRQDSMYPETSLLTVGFGSSVQPYPWLKPYSDSDSGRIETVFRADYEEYQRLHGEPTWMHLIREEVSELFNTRTSSHTIEEAVQVAALCIYLSETRFAQQEGDHQ